MEIVVLILMILNPMSHHSKMLMMTTGKTTLKNSHPDCLSSLTQKDIPSFFNICIKTKVKVFKTTMIFKNLMLIFAL